MNEKKIRFYPKKLYKVRVTVIKRRNPDTLEQSIKEYTFRFGKMGKDYYQDILKREGLEAAEDMKLIHIMYFCPGPYARPMPENINKYPQRCEFWRMKLLWNKMNVEDCMQDICKSYNMQYKYKTKKNRIILDIVYFRN